MITCPKCHATSGDSWSQCEGSCPMPMSPYYGKVEAKPYVHDPKETCPECDRELSHGPGGGVECRNCGWWFCY